MGMFGEQTSEWDFDAFDGEPSRTGQKDRFVARFEGELQRLADEGRALTPWQEENLLGALGAANLGEHDLACGMIEAAKRAPPAPRGAFRHQPMSLATLRRRFQRLL